MMLNFREHLIKDLISQGHQVYCFASDYSHQDRQVLNDWGAVAVDSPLNAKGLNPFKDIIAVWQLVKAIKAINPDVVFSYFVKPVIFGSIAARIAKVPRVIGMIEGLGNAFTKHQEGFTKKARLIQMIQIFLYRIALPKLDKLIVLNPDDKKDLVDCFKIKTKQTLVLGGIGLDLDEFLYTPARHSPMTFIFMGRLLKEKGVFEYLQAAEQVKEKYPDALFYLLGGFDVNNPFALKQQDLADYLDNGTIMYPGHVDNVHEWIQKSSVFVLPSYREGIPRSTQEAMAIGRPVITTDSPGCRETVVEGVNGFLIPPFSVSALVDKMTYFIENPQAVDSMGQESRKLAEARYDVKAINQTLISILLGSEQ